jgi:hypothetical protein
MLVDPPLGPVEHLAFRLAPLTGLDLAYAQTMPFGCATSWTRSDREPGRVVPVLRETRPGFIMHLADGATHFIRVLSVLLQARQYYISPQFLGTIRKPLQTESSCRKLYK